MTQPASISADYTLRPSELASVLALLVEASQPTIVWGPPGAAKSMIAQQVAAAANRQYVDVRALLLDPVDLRGIPWRHSADRTRWAPPAFLPPSDDPGLWLINLEELPSAVPMVQAALYQFVLDRRVGEYELPEGASLIACGIEPACCLYFTDMECSSYPEAEPLFPVLFCNYSDPLSNWNRERWGERIDIAA